MDICNLFSKKRESKTEVFFDDIIGHSDAKRLFSMEVYLQQLFQILIVNLPSQHMDALCYLWFMNIYSRMNFIPTPVFVEVKPATNR